MIIPSAVNHAKYLEQMAWLVNPVPKASRHQNAEPNTQCVYVYFFLFQGFPHNNKRGTALKVSRGSERRRATWAADGGFKLYVGYISFFCFIPSCTMIGASTAIKHKWVISMRNKINGGQSALASQLGRIGWLLDRRHSKESNTIMAGKIRDFWSREKANIYYNDSHRLPYCRVSPITYPMTRSSIFECWANSHFHLSGTSSSSVRPGGRPFSNPNFHKRHCGYSSPSAPLSPSLIRFLSKKIFTFLYFFFPQVVDVSLWRRPPFLKRSANSGGTLSSATVISSTLHTRRWCW